MKTKKEKPSYNVWQNVCYILGNAWKTDKKLVFLIAIGAVCPVIASIAEMYLPKTVIVYLQNGEGILPLCLMIVTFACVIAAMRATVVYFESVEFISRIKQRVDTYFSNAIRSYLQTDFCNLGKAAYQKLRERAENAMSSNISALEAIFGSLRTLTTNLLGFIVYLILLTAIHPLLLGVVWITAAVSFRLRKKCNQWEHEMGLEVQSDPNKRLLFVQNHVHAAGYAKDIRLFSLGNWIADIVQANKKILDDFQNKVSLKHFWIDLFDGFAIFLREGIAYVYLISMVLSGKMGTDQFVLLFAAIAGFSTWITGIMEQYETLHRQSLEICNYRDYIDFPSVYCHDGTPVEKAEKYELELRDVSFRYDGTDENVLEHINLKVKAGEKLAVVGLNGAGKTTLIQLICGLYDPTEGVVLLNGKDIRQYDRREYYKLFSAEFQDFSILPMSIERNVTGVEPEQVDRARFMKALQLADIDRKVNALPQKENTLLVKSVNPDAAELSGGETLRLMLARAIYKNGSILLLDEPTAALDPIAESRMYQHYNQVSEGKTAIYISHRLVSTRFCDRIIFLAEKQIMEQGTHTELMQKGGRYAELFEIQSRYYREEGEQDVKE